jgi:hypothetical protein
VSISWSCIAIVGQDTLRRSVRREHDVPDGAYIGLVDTVARYALDHGYHTIIEGIFYAATARACSPPRGKIRPC